MRKHVIKIIYFLDIASDVKRKKEHTPLSPLKRGIRKVVTMKERISPLQCGINPYFISL